MGGTAPIGIVAGSGRVPLELATALERQGRPVHLVAIDGFADAGVAQFPHTRVGLGQLGAMLGALRGSGCREIVIVGGLERPQLLRLRPDWGALRNLPAVLSLTRGGDDTLLRRIVRFFEGQGFSVHGIPDVAPELLATAGRIAGPELTPAQHAAVERARTALAALSQFDVGQAVVARADGVVAVEAAEGTRRMLARLAASGGAGADAVLVKLPKAGQEMRIDLPTIGAGTIAEAAAAGLSGIAVAAGATVIAERDEFAVRAAAVGVSVVGISLAAPAHDDGAHSSTPTPNPSPQGRGESDRARGDSLGPFTALPPSPLRGGVGGGGNQESDRVSAAQLAACVLDLAAPGVRDSGAVVRRGHALAVEIDGLALDHWPARLAALPRGWLPGPRRGSGMMALALAGPPDEAIRRRIAALTPALQQARLSQSIAVSEPGSRP